MSNELVKKEQNQNSMGNMFTDIRIFEGAVRMATALAKSTIVPKDYQNNASNTLIAIEVASRLNTSPLMIMQNLFVVNGRPGWSSSFLGGMINGSGKFKTNVQYEMENEGDKDKMECRAFVKDNKGDMLYGPWITMQMAKDEGWLSKTGSKWKTMPEVMIRYRALSFFSRLHCADLTMGFYTKDEVIDIGEADYEVFEETVVKDTIDKNANKEEIDIKPTETEVKTENKLNIDLETGEILEDSKVDNKQEELPQMGF